METENEKFFNPKDKGQKKETKEEKQTETKTETKTESEKQFFGLSSEDIERIIKEAKKNDLLIHLLTGIGAMAGSHFLSVKPLQDKMAEMKGVINEQADMIDELRSELEELKKEVEKKAKVADDYFTYKSNSNFSGNNHTYRRVNI